MLQASYSDTVQTEHNVIGFKLKNNSSSVLQDIIFSKALEESSKIFN